MNFKNSAVIPSIFETAFLEFLKLIFLMPGIFSWWLKRLGFQQFVRNLFMYIDPDKGLVMFNRIVEFFLLLRKKYNFLSQKYDTIWSISIRHFIKYKPLISEEWFTNTKYYGNIERQNEKKKCFSSLTFKIELIFNTLVFRHILIFKSQESRSKSHNNFLLS